MLVYPLSIEVMRPYQIEIDDAKSFTSCLNSPPAPVPPHRRRSSFSSGRPRCVVGSILNGKRRNRYTDDFHIRSIKYLHPNSQHTDLNKVTAFQACQILYEGFVKTAVKLRFGHSTFLFLALKKIVAEIEGRRTEQVMKR